MTKKLEELFDLPESEPLPPLGAEPAVPSELPLDPQTITAIDATIDKIDAALPGVRGLEASDQEMDDLAQMATKSYQDLMDLGMNVDARFSSEIFGVASNLLGHAITAKTAKLNKKLRMIDLQLKKVRLDQQSGDTPPPQAGTGMAMSRNELLAHILNGDGQKTNH
jgi:hypothetical protein